MATTGSEDFDRLLDDIKVEAQAEGPEAVLALRALQFKYRMINQLLERRHGLHWTQKDLAAHSGIAQSEISKIERGRKSPTMDTYSRLAAAMSVDEDVLASMATPHQDLVST